MALIITCLSQKGGVGKSTMARLIARTYANGGWTVKICDFNTRQKTSVDWVAIRMANDLKPEISAEPFTSVKALSKERHDLLVVDGKPDSDLTSLESARVAQLNIVPTGPSADDLRPQIAFANELVSKGIARDRILFVLNRTMDSESQSRDARGAIQAAGFRVTSTDLPFRRNYEKAQDIGAALSETGTPSLDERADTLAAEIVDRMNELENSNG